MTLQYIYADLPVGKEVGSLCIISSFFLSIFFSSVTLRLSARFTPVSLSLVVYRSFSLIRSIAQILSRVISFSLSLIFSLSLSQLGSVCAERLLPVAPNSVRNRNSHRFPLSRDSFPHASLFVCVSYYPRSAFISLHGSARWNKKDHLLRSRDFVASTTVASRTLGSLHASTPSTISSVSISFSFSLYFS